MKKVKSISKIRANRLKYLKLFPLFIEDIDRVSNVESIRRKRKMLRRGISSSLQTQETDDHWPCFQAKLLDDLIIIPDVEQSQKLFRYVRVNRSIFSVIEHFHFSSFREVLVKKNSLVQQQIQRHHYRWKSFRTIVELMKNLFDYVRFSMHRQLKSMIKRRILNERFYSNVKKKSLPNRLTQFEKKIIKNVKMLSNGHD